MRTRTEQPADLAARTLVHLRRVFHAIHSQSSTIESAIGITGPQLWALHAVVEAEEGLSLTEIAGKLVLHKANAGRLVDRLRARRLVVCVRPPHDRRVVLVTATARGRALLERTVPRPIQVELLERLEGLGARELRGIERSLARLVGLLHAEDGVAGLIVDDAPER